MLNFNGGKQWVSFNRSTWWLIVYCLTATGFALGFVLQTLMGD